MRADNRFSLGAALACAAALLTLAGVRPAAAQSPSVTISPTALRLSEGGPVGEYSVVLGSRPTGDVTVTATSTASLKARVAAPGGAPGTRAALTFTRDNWNVAQTVTVTARADEDDQDERVRIQHAVRGANYNGVRAADVTVTVLDDEDDPIVYFGFPQSSEHGENAGAVNVRLLASVAPRSAIEVGYGVTGTAAANSDFAIDSAGTARIEAGQNVAVIPVRIIDDGVSEVAETVVLTLRAGEGYALGGSSNSVYTLTIDDDDDTGVVISLPDPASNSLQLNEGRGSARYTVELTAEPANDVTVTALSSDPFSVRVAGPGGPPGAEAALTFTPENWNARQTVTITSVEDADGSDETVTVRHRVEGLGAGATAAALTVTVLDDEDPEISFARGATQAAERSGGGRANTVEVAVELSSAPERDLRLRYRVSGTATAGSDYIIAGLDTAGRIGVLTVPAGDRSGAIPVTIVDDGLSEDAETVVLTLEGGAGFTLGRNAVHRIDIDDNEGGVVVEPARLSLKEGGEPMEYTVRLRSDPGRDVVIVPTNLDPGAVTISGFLSFAGGAAGNWRQPQTVIVAPLDDADARNEEVTIVHTINGYGDATVPNVIVEVEDDDAAALSPVIVVTGGEAVSEGGIAQFTFTATPSPRANISVDIEVKDSGDFARGADIGPRSVTIGAGGTAALTVRTVDDAADEPDGAVSATIVSGAGYTVATPPSHTASVAVRDNDDPPPPPPAVSFAASAANAGEGDGTHSVAIAVDPPPGAAIVLNYTVGGTAEPGTDYTLINRSAVAVPAGAAAVRIPVTLADDREDEPAETVVLELTPGDGYRVDLENRRHVLTVVDNDSSGVTVAPAELSLEEGGTATYTVALDTDPGAGARVTVTPTVSDPGAVVASPHSLTFDSRNWNLPQTVNVSATDDDDDRDEDVSIFHGVSGYGSVAGAEPVRVAVADDDLRLSVVSIAGGGTVEEGGLATFTLRADPPPAAPVNVNISVVAMGDFAQFGQDGIRLVSVGTDGRGILSVATQDDGVEEAEGSISAVIGVGEGYGVAPPPNHSARVAVADNDAPPAISVVSFAAAASGAPETDGGAHRVAVELDPPAEAAFPLRFTVSGDASPGEDYTIGGLEAGGAGPAGTVDVPLGASSVAIELRIVGDDSYEFQERVVLTLAEGRGYEVDGDAAAHTVTMIDDDRAAGLQVQAESTVARLSRSLSEQWLQGVADRLSMRSNAAAGPPSPPAGETFQLAIAGRTGWFDPETGWLEPGGWTARRPPPLPAAAPSPTAVAGTGHPGAPARAIPVAAAMQDAPAGGAGPGAPAPDPAAGGPERGLRGRVGDLLARSSFLLRGPQLGSGSLGFWGRGASARVAGGSDAFSMDADMTSVLLGADWTGVWLTLGVMVSSGDGDGGYRAGNIDGGLDLSLTGVTPYVGYRLGERTSIWGALNASGGTLKLRPADGEGADADLSSLALAAGARSELYAGAGGLSLSLLGDALSVSADTGALGDGLPGVETAASRLRLALEGAWTRTLAGGGQFRARFEAGLRGDAGDAEEGFGAEVAGGVSWTAANGLTVELAGRELAVHADDAFEQSGASVMVAWDPTPGAPTGPTLSMRRGRGADTASGVVGRLHRADSLAGLAGGAPEDPMDRTDIELGWGLPWSGERYVLTPSVNVGRAGGGREAGLGWRLRSADFNDLDLSAGFRAAWREPRAALGGADGAGDNIDRAVEMEMRVRW